MLVLGFGYWTLSPLWRIVIANDPLPTTANNQVTKEVSSTQPTEQRKATFASVLGTPGHSASGTARVVEVDGVMYLRYENFHTINGPDLFVYLATDTQATEFVNLGALKATDGNVNYVIPAGTDISKYTHALVWCKAFGVLFNFAVLQN